MQSSSLRVPPPVLEAQAAMTDKMAEYENPTANLQLTLLSSFPSLFSIAHPTFIGSFAWTSKAGGFKLMQERSAIATVSGYLTPADVARVYIHTKYEKPGRITSKQYREIMLHRQASLYAKPGIYPNASYIDLKSAYWSILQIIGWDVDYMPGRWIAKNSDNRDFPYWKNKLARNCLVSVGLTGEAKMWTGEKLVTHKKQNPYTNMMLWACVQDVLAGVAGDMVEAGAVYVHTDGYILPEGKKDTALDILASWGLVGEVRDEGNMDVIAAGTYSAPKKPDNRMGSKRRIYHNNLRPVDRAWLRKRILLLKEQTQLVLY